MFTFILNSEKSLKYTPIGGYSVLIKNYAEYYQNTSPVKIIMSKDSYLFNYLTENNIKFQFIDINNDFRTSINENDILFTTYRRYFPLHLDSNPLLFCWAIHPTMFFSWIRCTLDQILLKNKLSKVLIRKIIKELYEKESLFFMDGTNKEATEEIFKIKFDRIEYLPIPIYPNKTGIKISRGKSGVKNITYLGRGNEIWKVKPLKHICKCLSEECSDYSFNFRILTDTNELFKKELQELKLDNIKVEYLNGFNGEKLRDYLYNNSDLHFAMGTSALEGAVCGIPTIVMDASDYDFPDNYKFKWLFETKDYSLGDLIELKKNRVNLGNNLNIREIIQKLNSQYEYEKITRMTYDYVNSNHSLKNIFKKIDESLPYIRARYKDIRKYIFAV